MRGGDARSTSWTTSAGVAWILAGAFLCASALLLYQLRGRELNLGVSAELLLVIVLSLEGIVAVQHLRHARRDSVHQVLVSVMQDYRSTEIFAAINALWRFRREHGERFVEEYIGRWREDDARIAKLPPEARVAALGSTLHYQRRIVKEFFTMLAGLHDIGVLPRDLLYAHWNETELRIIPEIVVPLESAVTRELKTTPELGRWYSRLMSLYDDRPAPGGRRPEAPRLQPHRPAPVNEPAPCERTGAEATGD